jgi:PRC-barrel domain
MLWKASAIEGYAIAATDGPIGTITDFLFDDASWQVRWVVVDTGNWLAGRRVLLPPSAMGHLNATGHDFSVRLTMQQVKDSPDVDTQRPVSRQMEASVYDYYGWYPYWTSSFYIGSFGYAGEGPMAPLDPDAAKATASALGKKSDDLHLRSVAAVTGYHLHATDGELGHAADFLIEDGDWSIHYLIVDTKNWWPGKLVLVSPRSVQSIDWSSQLISLDANRQKVKDSPAYDPSIDVDRTYEKQFHAYYGGANAGPPFSKSGAREVRTSLSPPSQ